MRQSGPAIRALCVIFHALDVWKQRVRTQQKVAKMLFVSHESGRRQEQLLVQLDGKSIESGGHQGGAKDPRDKLMSGGLGWVRLGVTKLVNNVPE